MFDMPLGNVTNGETEPLLKPAEEGDTKVGAANLVPPMLLGDSIVAEGAIILGIAADVCTKASAP